jgi:hypothetical protein
MASSNKSQGPKTRHQSSSKLTEFVGPGKEFEITEVPTGRAIVQKGILIREKLMIVDNIPIERISKTTIARKLTPLIFEQWQRSNGKFVPPVTIQEKSIFNRVRFSWTLNK